MHSDLQAEEMNPGTSPRSAMGGGIKEPIMLPPTSSKDAGTIGGADTKIFTKSNAMAQRFPKKVPFCNSASASCVKSNGNANSPAHISVITSSSNHANSIQFQFNDHHRPILVGYAFGPKKMSTMSVVMAEASMAVSTVVTHFPPHLRNNPHNSGQGRKRKWKSSMSSTSTASCPSLAPSPYGDNSCDGNQGQGQHNQSQGSSEVPCQPDADYSLSYPQHNLPDDVLSQASRNDLEVESIAQSIDIDDITTFTPSNSHANSAMPVPRITCIFPSSFHLPSKSSSVTLEDASLVTATTASTFNGASAISNASTTTDLPQHLQPMRVCFVPLDLDAPLDEQHGGKFDAILHKMTEDILCKSQLAASVASSTGSVVHKSLQEAAEDESERQALKRIGRLWKYKQDHPACCLVDHPNNVQAVMNRADIANILTECLKGVSTKSGIPVRTPSYQVLNGGNSDDGTQLKSSDASDPRSQSYLKNRYPLIVKPLTAAGTKQSHKMGVLLGRHGLDKVRNSGPSLLQEYSNHDGILFKVYVLGDKVWVFQRPSLPNLPTGEIMEGEGRGFVEFDSQRPYPSLDDFGYSANARSAKVSASSDSTAICARTKLDHIVTSAEIRPLAYTIRKAFGLELFGFDILVTRTENGSKEMLVVDVNYFPSYKEVTNFPKMLAQYLAQCGIEGRLRSF